MNMSILSTNPADLARKTLAPASHEEVRREILRLYRVSPTEQFDAKTAIRDRIEYLKRQLRTTGRRGFVLGISGGVDSTTAGRMAQLACEELRAEGVEAEFYAVRLPAGVQRDEDEAQAALRFIGPDKVLSVNVGAAANALNSACVEAVASIGDPLSVEQVDYHKGNIKARLRMTAQYHLAAVYGCLVLGTDHFSEAVAGFFSKFGDGACDLVVLNGLNKRQVRACAAAMGAPEALWKKPPTADLEELNPGKLDDEGFGFPYDALDDFLEGKSIDFEVEKKIVALYVGTRHKRDPIVTFD